MPDEDAFLRSIRSAGLLPPTPGTILALEPSMPYAASSSDLSSYDSNGSNVPDTPGPRYVRLVFGSFIASQVVFNYDNGAIPASLATLSHEFSLDYFFEGLLGSLVYLGLVLSCLLAGYLFQVTSAKWVICASLFSNTVFYALFTLAYSPWALLAARFGVGLSRTFIVVYAPVWVDEFAPSDTRTLWLSLQQAGVPLGVMFGYLVTGILDANTRLSWRWSFMIQVFACLPVCIIFLLLPANYINVNRTSAVSRKWEHCFHLFRNPVYLCTIFSLSGLYFVVTGIQVWVTQYLTGPPVEADANTVIMAFTATTATAPILGVLMGGKVIDYIGGYRVIPRAALLAIVLGTLSQINGTLCLVVSHFWTFIVLVWFVLFFGGAIVPAGTGIMLSSVGKDARPQACGLAMLTYNLFGYFAGPFISGTIAERTSNLSWGFRTVILWGWVAWVFMVLTYFFALREQAAPKTEDDVELAP
eukprot:NODE_225_length_1617_cov_333.228954_g159_i0.p1 GENE.NODE_225_length_1617_cov_333.228954_g159_i0~~NODE_225_length_1617_cov_333.228954_g159_i0.p1  ORF type:complete len:472 (-),score=143.91 NODE_225_length_1617_cov_333.228954_g159_i0:71-1486(-)